jgi:hypothetical protein
MASATKVNQMCPICWESHGKTVPLHEGMHHVHKKCAQLWYNHIQREFPEQPIRCLTCQKTLTEEELGQITPIRPKLYQGEPFAPLKQMARQDADATIKKQHRNFRKNLERSLQRIMVGRPADIVASNREFLIHFFNDIFEQAGRNFPPILQNNDPISLADLITINLTITTKEELGDENFNAQFDQFIIKRLLIHSAEKGDAQTIRALLSNDQIKNIFLGDSLKKAAQTGHTEIVQLMLPNEEFPENVLQEASRLARLNGHDETAQIILPPARHHIVTALFVGCLGISGLIAARLFA